MTDVQELPSQSTDDDQQIETLEDRKQRSREMVQVTPGRGLTPSSYAEYITWAQGVCKPDNLMLREDLRSNIAVVIGLMDIAERAHVSVYMLAMKTYVQKGVLCMESQAFHALAKPHLDGGLKGEWIGEGDERQLIVRGRLKGDPFEYEHRSPKLAQVHPGHTTKHVNGEVLQFVKGSPLWDRKPDVQLWYDTTRDWIRMYCPQAVLGVYTPEEVADPEFRDVTPRPTLGERLAASPRPELREGFRPMEVESSLVRAAGDDRVAQEMANTPIAPREEAVPVTRSRMSRKPPARKRPGSAPKAKAGPKAKPKPKPRQQPAQLPLQGAPEGVDQAAYYVAQAEVWIRAATDPEEATARWENEYDTRNAVDLDSDERERLRAMLDERCEQLRGAKP